MKYAVVIGLACAAFPGWSTRAGDSVAADVAAIIGPRVEKGDTVGVVVGIVRDGRSEVFGFGRPSIDDDERPDGRTIFEIGSITKVFTSVALADMAEAGLLRLDDPVKTLLPAGVVVPERNGRAITLRDLATHRSGLPTVIPKVFGRGIAGKDPYAEVTPDDLFDFLKTYELKRDPGASYAYANFGAGLLGTALARRAGMSYEELIRARICGPLGMNDTRVTLDPARSLRLAHPYKMGGAPEIPWTFDAFAGAGALRSTVDDMLIFARANLGLAPAPGTLGAALRAARAPRAPADREGVKVALGWHVFESKRDPDRSEVIWHNGGTGGFRSFLGLVEAKKRAVVILSNSNAEFDSSGLAILERITRD